MPHHKVYVGDAYLRDNHRLNARAAGNHKNITFLEVRYAGDKLRILKRGARVTIDEWDVWIGHSTRNDGLRFHSTTAKYPPTRNWVIVTREKTPGVKGQWRCSKYYRDVCRWDPGRPAEWDTYRYKFRLGVEPWWDDAFEEWNGWWEVRRPR